MHDPIFFFRNNLAEGLISAGSILLVTNQQGGTIFQYPCTVLPASIVDSAIAVNDQSGTLENTTRDPSAVTTTSAEARSSEILCEQERNNPPPSVTQGENIRT